MKERNPREILVLPAGGYSFSLPFPPDENRMKKKVYIYKKINK
jgi:hypothetical protein